MTQVGSPDQRIWIFYSKQNENAVYSERCKTNGIQEKETRQAYASKQEKPICMKSSVHQCSRCHKRDHSATR